ncbi:hypothetical protein N7490_004090 [Penicillium lividum]|nr:hypothetical protein N7490_004090 [Penicillium lividum]
MRCVTYSNGKVYTGDVIIGADGIHSASGKSVFGKLPVVGDGFSAYQCMIPTAKMRNNPETAILVDAAKVLIIVGPDRRIVAYPCSSWETMNFVCIFPDDRKMDHHQSNTGVSAQEMVDMFKDFHPSVSTFLSMASNTGVWQLLDREPLSTLVNGSFAMIGDAADAMGPRKSPWKTVIAHSPFQKSLVNKHVQTKARVLIRPSKTPRPCESFSNEQLQIISKNV